MENLPSIRELVKKYSVNAEKKLGQNFLFDLNITDKIARSTGKLDNYTVIEVGPGLGSLTRSILNAGAKKVIAVEKDIRCISALNDYLVPKTEGRLEIIDDDALSNDVYKNIPERVKLIANLPYNISTKLLFKWLDDIDNFSSLTLMFQKEVADRIVAEPNSKDYGRISIKTQLLCEVNHEFDIPPSAFYPPPNVNSSVVTITPREKPLFDSDTDKLDTLCKAVFGQRRKALRVSLKQISKNPTELLEKADIEQMRRPESLSVKEFCKLANCL